MVTKAERRWWWKLTLNAISQVLVMHPTLHFCHTTSTVQLEKLTWQKEKEREKGFLILHPKLPSHSQIKIQLTLFSPCRLWRSSLYSALKFATMHTHLSPFHQTMQSTAKQSEAVFFVFCFFNGERCPARGRALLCKCILLSHDSATWN